MGNCTLELSITMASRKQLLRQAHPIQRKNFLSKYFCYYHVLLTIVTLIPATLLAQNPSPLASAGYAVLPVPQKVVLTGKDFALDSEWRLELEGGVKENDVAVESLKEGLATRFDLNLAATHTA